MIRFKDVLLNILLLFFFAVSMLVLIGLGMPFLFFIPLMLIIVLKIYLENKKRILKYVEADFKSLGYELLTERPYKLSETETSFRLYTGVKINNIPIERFYYIKRFDRVFTAKAEDGNSYTLFTRITKEWNGKNTIDIRQEQLIES